MRTGQIPSYCIEKVSTVNALRKIERIFYKLYNTSQISGICSPQPLKHNLTEFWSRQIDEKLNYILG